MRISILLYSAILLTGCQVEVFSNAQQSQPSNSAPTNDNSPLPPNSETNIEQTVILYWHAPLERENGDQLLPDEIAGYEVRYKSSETDRYTSIYLAPEINQYEINSIPNPESAIIEVAVYDTDGIYSDFVGL